jgi:hypothetical protein
MQHRTVHCGGTAALEALREKRGEHTGRLRTARVRAPEAPCCADHFDESRHSYIRYRQSITAERRTASFLLLSNIA